MNAQDVLQRVGACIISTFRLPKDTPITRETTSADVDGWDSLSHAMLIMKVEEEFSLELPFDEIYDLENVGALADLVQATLTSSAPSS